MVDSLTVDTFPRTLMLLGEFGCGKHTLIEYIADKFKFEIEDISDNLTLELIDNISTRSMPKIYVINSSKLTVKNENVILKFLEEPLKNSFIILLAERRESIILTVLNRCQIWEFESYPPEYIESLLCPADTKRKRLLLEVANTPGKVDAYRSHPLDDMVQLAHKIFHSIHSANFANVLTIGRFVSFKNEKDRYDFNLFLDVLLAVCKDTCYSCDPLCYDMYELTRVLNANKYVYNIDKRALFEHYLIELKLLVDGNSV
jgi:hypothetical protein